MKTAIQYQSSSMNALRRWPTRRKRLRSVRDLARDQEEEQDGEQRVEAAEADQREEGRPGMNGRARALGRSEEAVNEPGLPSQLRRQPAGGDGDVRKRKGHHDNPEHRPRALETSGPGEKRRERHDRDEDRAEA